jgi:OmcA/MtrC family decaheme c-type cytochrome
VSFTLSDGRGTGLDTTGRLSDGTVAVSFVLAQLGQERDGSPAQYTAYTTHVQTSPITSESAVQATAESGGALRVLDVASGSYTYEFAAPLTAMAPAATQTVAALAVRTTTGTEAIARTTLSARPDGGPTAARELVTVGACNGCHGALDAHGGRWNSPAQCVLCHQPQSSDPDTGNTVDFKVMVHKLHRGKNLPSKAPYQIIGFGQVVSDFSTVVFPREIAECTACHAGAQAERWRTAPSKAVCTSCHDNTSFVLPVPTGQVLHGGGEQSDDATCAICHPARGGLAGITDKHLTGVLASAATQVSLEIQSITSTGPGQTPVMTLRALVDGAPRNLIAQPLTSLVATIAGPNTDFATAWQAAIQGDGAAGALTAVDAAQGVFQYAFPDSAAIPAGATGSYTVGLEGSLRPVANGPRYAAESPVQPFLVSGQELVRRRKIVDGARCDACHRDLAGHDGSRKNPQYCVLCHNPGKANDTGAPRFQGSSVLAPSVDFRVMIHKIHRGDELARPYALFGFPAPTPASPGGTPLDFAQVRYPRPVIECEACHAARNWTLPMTASTAYLPSTELVMTCSQSTDPTAYCDDASWKATQRNLLPPQTSVCTSCHDSADVAAHAQLNTTPAGAEACATCHGPGAAEDVGRLHGAP